MLYHIDNHHYYLFIITIINTNDYTITNLRYYTTMVILWNYITITILCSLFYFYYHSHYYYYMITITILYYYYTITIPITVWWAYQFRVHRSQASSPAWPLGLPCSLRAVTVPRRSWRRGGLEVQQWSSVRKMSKCWKKHGKTWEKRGKTWKNIEQHGKTWKNIDFVYENHEKIGNFNCEMEEFTVELPGTSPKSDASWTNKTLVFILWENDNIILMVLEMINWNEPYC